MPAFSIFSSICVAAVALMLVLTRRGDRRSEWVLKPLASSSFVAAAIAAGGLDLRVGTVIVAGLALSWWGDLLLIPRSKRLFLVGLVAFLLGHVCYAVAFGMRGVSWPATAVAAVAVGLALIPVARWLLPSVEAPMKLPVLAYMVVISTMVTLSIGTAAHRASPWIVIGTIAFYLSDLSVARDRFIATTWTNKLWGWPLYFGAQLILAWCAGQP